MEALAQEIALVTSVSLRHGSGEFAEARTDREGYIGPITTVSQVRLLVTVAKECMVFVGAQVKGERKHTELLQPASTDGDCSTYVHIVGFEMGFGGRFRAIPASRSLYIVRVLDDGRVDIFQAGAICQYKRAFCIGHTMTTNARCVVEGDSLYRLEHLPGMFGVATHVAQVLRARGVAVEQYIPIEKHVPPPLDEGAGLVRSFDPFKNEAMLWTPSGQAVVDYSEIAARPGWRLRFLVKGERVTIGSLVPLDMKGKGKSKTVTHRARGVEVLQ